MAERLVPLMAATLIAFIGIGLAVKKMGQALEPLSPAALLSCGAVWVAIYGLMFFISLERVGGRYPIQGVPPSIYARYALAALGLWLLFTGLMEFSGIERFTTALLFPAAGLAWYFFLGVVYSFFPLIQTPFFMPRKKLSRISAHGAFLGVAFLFLLTPQIMLYCSSFTLGIAFNWTLGTIVGCAIGGPTAVWLDKKVPLQLARYKPLEGATYE